MRFRVKDYCRIILYLPSEEKLKASYSPEKPKRIEDHVDMRLSEDETPVESEDAHMPSSLHRPPSYNPEDYAHALVKYARSTNLYSHDHKEKKGRGKEKDKSPSKTTGPEMSLKQFASLPELLRRLREDLKTAFISFVKELVRDPHDGVSLLLDLLKMIQLAQSNLTGNGNNREQQIALRRTLIDEFECLCCLRCCLRCSDAAPKIATYRNGLYALAAATMSSLTRSRTIALQLLTKACENSVCGHRQVIEAFSTLRLRFAEPVRCKFLVSMMLSYPHPSFQVWGLKLVNAMLSSAVSLKERIYLQEELGEAGFDSASIKKALEHRGAATAEQQAAVKAELDKWNEGYIDLNALEEQLTSLKTANVHLKQELSSIRQANVKLLEENVLVKAVGGEVEERCLALRRRLEKHGMPTAPSPTPSVTDSEISSFVNTGRSTVKKMNLESPSGTLGRAYGANGEKSMSLEWRMIRPPSEGKGPSREGSDKGDGNCDSIIGNGFLISGDNVSSSHVQPIPKRRQLFSSQHSPNHPVNGIYLNDLCDSHEQNRHSNPAENGVKNNKDHRATQNSTPNGSRCGSSSSIRSNDTSLQESPGHSSSQSDLTKNDNLNSESDYHIYQSPVKPVIPQKRRKSSSSKSSTGSNDEKEIILDKREKGGTSIKSLSSSTSSLSTVSTPSLDGVEEKEHMDPQYENIPTREKEKNVKSSINNNSKNENVNSKACNKTKLSCEEADIDYERDVVVYEAITLGNDTILMDKNNTNGSNSSKGSKSSCDKPHNEEDTNVRRSVRHYENLSSGEKISSSSSQNSTIESRKGETSKSILNGLIKGLRSSKKKDSRSGKDSLKSNRSNKKKERKEDVSDKEVEAVMNGLENVIKSAESSISMGSLGTVKENPLTKEGFEDRASPEQTTTDIEIVASRGPQIPARSKSRGTSSSSSRCRTPDPIVYFESPSETSDTDTLMTQSKAPPSPVTMDTASTKSFGWVRGNPPLRRRDTCLEKSPGQNEDRRHRLKRSESVHANHLSEYNSHRSYSPRRRGSADLLMPLEESEIHISGRRYTKYTAPEVERRNYMNNLLSSKMQTHNRSYDDRLDQWLDEDCMRQQMEINRHSRRSYYKSPGENIKSSRSRTSSDHHGDGCYSSNDMTAFNGFKNPKTKLRESDFGPNFMLNSPTHPHRLEGVLNNMANAPIHMPRKGRSRKVFLDDPAIPTPDYSATPSGTLKNDGNLKGRHILDMVSGLY